MFWENGTQCVPSARGGGSAAVVVAAAVVVSATVSIESVPAAAEEKNDDDEPPAGVVAIPRVKAHGFVTSLKVFVIVYARVCKRETWPLKFS